MKWLASFFVRELPLFSAQYLLSAKRFRQRRTLLITARFTRFLQRFEPEFVFGHVTLLSYALTAAGAAAIIAGGATAIGALIFVWHCDARFKSRWTT